MAINSNTVYSPSPTFLHRQRQSNTFAFDNPTAGLPRYFHDATALFFESYTQDDLYNFEDYIWQ